LQLKITNKEQGISNTLQEKRALLDLKKSKHLQMITDGLYINQQSEIVNNQLILEGMELDELATQQKIANAFKLTNSVVNTLNQYQKLQQTQLDADKATELSAANSIRSERLRQRKINEINEIYAAKQKDLNKESKRIKRTQTVINTSVGIMEALSDKTITSTFAKIAMAALIGAQGAMQLSTIDAQKYATGGMVGGNRHSQGGTMIEAEKGEYVVSRKGVESAGIEALNRINAGGGSGSVNISFNGNVLSKDFIEDEAIPQIKEAIRRGADIGIG